MSGQYPGFNSPVGGHRGQFNPQQQMVNMNQMVGGGVVGGAGMQQNMGGAQAPGMLPMVGGVGYPQGGGMMQHPQQQQQPMQGTGGGLMPGGGMGVMNPVGMQSPSHAQQMSTQQQQQQQLMQQQHMQMQQQQQQQQQMQVGAAGAQMVLPLGGAPVVGPGLMQQQQLTTQNPSQQQLLGASAVAASLQQQQQSQAPSNMLATSQPNPHKEINIVALSRLGQETVQDITSRFQEIFAALKIIQPTANRDNNTEKKVQEYFRTIRLLFKRVRIIYEKCNDGYPQGMEYTHVESLIPYKDETDHRSDPTQCEEYRKASLENQELIETVKLKNRQLREIIDRTRIIIWEINTMLSMRRS